MLIDFSKRNVEIARSEFKSHKKGDGKRGPFYASGEYPTFEKNDDLLFRNAVWQGYLDASRTFYKINTSNRTAFANLAEKIQGFFEGKEKFNHECWCSSFINDIKTNNEYECRYGQAQKVVNMTFKYLYCCDGIDVDKFADCHMPLDKYTLAWLFSEGGKFYTDWSYFDQEMYTEVQKEIRTKLKEKCQNDVLAAELVIWKAVPDYIVDLKDIAMRDTVSN